jgi:hypothetical protein
MIVPADTLRLAFGAEAGTPPVLPATPPFQLARITSETIALNAQTQNSAELNPSGQVSDSILTGANTTGDVNFEVSNNPWFEEMLSALLRDVWGTGMYDGVALTPDQLIVGALLKTYTIEKRFSMPGGVFDYHRFRNCAVANGSITITPGAPIVGKVTIAGGPLDEPDDAEIPGSVYTSAGEEPVMTAPLVTELTIDAGTVVARCLSQFVVNLNSNVRGIQCIGTLGEREKVLGRFEAAMTGTVYFASDDMLLHLLHQDTFPVTLKITDSLGAFYTFEFPRCKVTAAPVTAGGGTNSDVTVALAMSALFDEAKGSTLLITRSADVIAAAAAGARRSAVTA